MTTNHSNTMNKPKPSQSTQTHTGLTAEEHKLRRRVCNKLNKTRDIDLLHKIAKLLSISPTPS